MEAQRPNGARETINFRYSFHCSRIDQTNASVWVSHCGYAFGICDSHIGRSRSIVDTWYRLKFTSKSNSNKNNQQQNDWKRLENVSLNMPCICDRMDKHSGKINNESFKQTKILIRIAVRVAIFTMKQALTWIVYCYRVKRIFQTMSQSNSTHFIVCHYLCALVYIKISLF